MKSKLLSAIALPAMLAVGAATAIAQTPAPSPSAPAERMPDTTPVPSPTPAPEATPAPSVPAPSADTSASADKGGTFSSSQSADEWRSTKLVGLAVYNQANERIGDINDLILGPDGKIASAVIGVGGFLGIGEKLVAVEFSDMQLNRDADGTLRVTVNSSKEALETAPEYKYYEASSAVK
jgi:hypothetical protein